jgi:hypothetical protein
VSLIITIVLLRVTPPHRSSQRWRVLGHSSRSRLVSRETKRETDETRTARSKTSKTKTMPVLPAPGVPLCLALSRGETDETRDITEAGRFVWFWINSGHR